MIELPPQDADFATRWRLIKMGFSKAFPRTERLSKVRAARGERGVWQRRYWEHLIRDERVADWAYSAFQRLAERDVYPRDWAVGEDGVGYVD